MNIFVAKLSPITTGEDLLELFREFGKVASAKVLTDRETGLSKCFGFVEMYDYIEATKAIDALNGSELHGNLIIVKAARPREDVKRTEKRPRPKLEVGKSNESRRPFQNRYKDKDKKRSNFSPRRERGNDKQQMRKPHIKEYTMMELMEDDD